MDTPANTFDSESLAAKPTAIPTMPADASHAVPLTPDADGYDQVFVLCVT